MKTLPYFEDQIRAFAETDPTTEQCGLVLRSPEGLLMATHETNTHPQPENFFAIATDVHMEARLDGNLVGYWHSHREDHPQEISEADKAVADAQALVVWTWMHGLKQLHCYAPQELRQEDSLEGRRFLPMVHDCVSLVADYYRTTLGIELPFVPRTQGDYANGYCGQIPLEDLMETAGAQIVQPPVMRHDIILMGIRSTRVNHLGVYIGEGIMLHQPLNRESERVPYGGAWAKQTMALVRIPGVSSKDSRPTRPIWEKLPSDTAT